MTDWKQGNEDNAQAGETPKTLEQQFRELLKHANLSFGISGAAAPASEPERGADEAQPEKQEDPLDVVRRFDRKPREVRDYLDRFVIGQNEAKKVLAVAICDHYNHVRRCLSDPEAATAEYGKHNVLLMGPTGVGKTYLVRCVARLIGVPFVKADATKFSETGYVGHDVEDLARDLVKMADGNVELARYGIIFLDEVDKIAGKSGALGRDVSGRGVQINLLKLMEETEASLFSQTDILGQMQAMMDMQRGKGMGPRTINTKHILFIVSGAFDGLGEIVRRRVTVSPIGFTSDGAGQAPDEAWLRRARTADLIAYGFEPEFVGRLPVRVVCDPLSERDLGDILLNSEDSILAQYRRDFEGYGITMRAAADAVRAIAREAGKEKTGARGLMTVMERLFRDFKFELPSTGIKVVDFDEAAVHDPAAGLRALLASCAHERQAQILKDLEAFTARFEAQHGLSLQIDQDARDYLVGRCLERGSGVRAFCDLHFKDLEYGLKLIGRNTGQTAFRLTRKFVENPDKELAARIARSFRPTGGEA